MLTIRFVAVIVIVVVTRGVVAPGFETCLLFGGVGGALLQDLIVDDPLRDVRRACNAIDCTSNGRCVAVEDNDNLRARCLCKEGYCGDRCVKSTEMVQTSTSCPCELQNTVCVEDMCVCRCGYVYYPTGDICIRECPQGTTLGNTYTEFTRQKLENFLLSTIDMTTVEACKAACTANPICRAFGFRQNIGRCRLHTVGKDDVQLAQNNNHNFHQRDCVQD